MTINKNEVVTIPKWLLIVIVPVLISILTTFAANRFRAGKQEKINEVTMEAIKANAITIKELKVNEIADLRNVKVDRNEFIILRDQMDRIERKLDTHMDK